MNVGVKVLVRACVCVCGKTVGWVVSVRDLTVSKFMEILENCPPPHHARGRTHTHAHTHISTTSY